VKSWCKRWNIKLNEGNNRAVHFSRRIRPVETNLTLNGRNLPFVNHVKYLGVILVEGLHGEFTFKR
jgi:hypothetical protein